LEKGPPKTLGEKKKGPHNPGSGNNWGRKRGGRSPKNTKNPHYWELPLKKGGPENSKKKRAPGIRGKPPF